MFKSSRTYHYAVVAHKFVKAGRIGLALVVTITLLISVVEGAKIVAMNAVAGEDIGDEFYS
jgi:hypothetical protein